MHAEALHVAIGIDSKPDNVLAACNTIMHGEAENKINLFSKAIYNIGKDTWFVIYIQYSIIL